MDLGELSPNSQVRNTCSCVLKGMDAKNVDLARWARCYIVASSPSRLSHMANPHCSFSLVSDLDVCGWALKL